MDQTEHLDIVVSTEDAERIRDLVKSGTYASASEVFRAALKALEKTDDRLPALRQKLQASLDDPRPDIPLDIAFDTVRKHLARR